MAHGKSLTLRAIKPTARYFRMDNIKSFVCTRETCRARRRNVHFKRLPQGMGNMTAATREAYASAIKAIVEGEAVTAGAM